jgi:uncharacterized protein YjdB
MIRFVVCLLAVVALLASSGCQSSPALSIIQVMLSSASLTTVGETVQFKAIGTFVHGGHPQQTRDLSGQVNWSSSTPAVATVSSFGLVTAVSTGSTTITATMNSSSGPVRPKLSGLATKEQADATTSWGST